MLITAIVYNYAIGQSLEQELQSTTQQSQRQLADQDVAIANLTTALENQTQQFEACKEHTSDTPIEGCETPVADSPDKIVEDVQASGIPALEGKQGLPGRPPTGEEIFGAVESYCATPLLACKGDPGVSGQDGQDGQDGSNGANGLNASPEQIAQAVADYCAANNGCKGADGTNGTNGQNGADAPALTQDQINTAVAQYCSTNGCTGPAGPPGPAGQDGVSCPNSKEILTLSGKITVCMP